MAEKKIVMGSSVEDIITGFKGVVTGTASYFTGCDQVMVNPKAKKDGSYTDGVWFDVNRLRVLKIEPMKLKDQKADRPGGPQQSPARR